MQSGRRAEQSSCHQERWGQVTAIQISVGCIQGGRWWCNLPKASWRQLISTWKTPLAAEVNQQRARGGVPKSFLAGGYWRVLWCGSSLPETSHLLTGFGFCWLTGAGCCLLCISCSQGKRGGSIWAEQSQRHILRQSQAQALSWSLYRNSSWRTEQSLNIVTALTQFMQCGKHFSPEVLWHEIFPETDLWKPSAA